MTSCAHCSRPITVTSRNPNRRYCSPRCRVADWHARHDRTHLAGPGTLPNDVHDDVPRNAAANDVADLVPDTAKTRASNGVPAPNGVPAANGDQRCPHCRQPLAVNSVLVPAAAAHIPTPEVIHMHPG
jgi:endogenous inhibitor of DNA gyrase (YacG/DUF329 family)